MYFGLLFILSRVPFSIYSEFLVLNPLSFLWLACMNRRTRTEHKYVCEYHDLETMKTARIKECLRHTNRIVVFCACSLFLISVLFPFLTIMYHSVIPEDSFRVTYWSCKTTIKPIISLALRDDETYWFTSYWFAQRKPYSYPTPITLGVSWVLVTMLSMQTFTLGSGFATLFLHRKFTKLFPLISCLSVIFLMTFVVFQAQNQTYGLPEYELGYWFCYPSAILFLLAFLLHHRTDSDF